MSTPEPGGDLAPRIPTTGSGVKAAATATRDELLDQLAQLTARIAELEKHSHPPVDIGAAVRAELLRMVMKPRDGG